MKIFLSCVLLCATICFADRGVQNGIRAAEGSKPVSLQPWLLGLTAVVGFLLLVFIILIIQRLLKKREDAYDKPVDMDEVEIYHTRL